MTSTNDGKDVKINQTSGPKGKSYYIELYKSLDGRLSGECGLCERTQHLCEAWRRVHSLCLHSAPATHPHLLSWLQRHTAKTILHTKWSKEEQNSLHEAIDAFIEETETGRAIKDGVIPPWEKQLLQRGQWFKRVLANPWGHPVLRLLLDPTGEPPTDEQILEWLKEERGVMFVTRLRQLATSKCADLAVFLVTAVMDRVRASTALVPDEEQSEELRDKPKPKTEKPTFEDTLTAEAGFTVDVWELLTDIEYVLLHKGDSRSKCIDLAKQTPLRNGYQLVERLQGRLETSPREKKLWKNAKEVATLIAQVVIARCMVIPVCSNVTRTALYCCSRSLVRLLPPGKLESAAAALAAPAATARHLHTLAAATLAQRGTDLTPFVCELYVRAITAGMNELERLKLNAKKEAEARLQEQMLSSWFTQLGNLLSASSRLRCECTLTAFSVHPAPAMYGAIQQAPPLPPLVKEQDLKEETTSEFGSWATDSRTQTNLVKTSETLNLKHTQNQANVLSTATLTEGEALGLSPELCQDLAVLLSGPRVKTLSWDMDREKLLENCRTYMERTHGGTRALTTELKYLNLDPRCYQHLPEEDDMENDAFYGIEKGYEHLVEVQEQEEIWQDAFFDPERTESASSVISDIVPTTVRKKKKKKPPIISSGEDSDPLSLVAEAKRTEKKKERPLSKERSKEKKEKKKSKSKDGSDKKESSRERRKEGSDPKEKKEKKPRKKKQKEEAIAVFDKPGSLSSLIGMKVANINIPQGKYKKNIDSKMFAPCITDSDYDSQGKSSLASLNSEGNDPDVLFDGLYNMEEYRSPEKVDPLADRSTYTSGELSVANGRVAFNTTTSHRKDDNKYTSQTSNSNVYRTQDLNSSKNAAIREEVKKSISRLIEFRRQKSLLEETQIFKSSGSSPATSYSDRSVSPKSSPIVRTNSHNLAPLIKSPTAIIRPEFPEPTVISPKAVEVPEIPKAYINKKQVESLKELKQEVDMLFHPQYSNNPVIQYASKQPAQTSCESSFQQYLQQRQLLFAQNLSLEIPQARPSGSVIYSSREDPEKEIQKNFQDFLKELQESINAGTGANKKAHTQKNVPAKKKVKPMSRVTPVIPNFPKTELGTSSQCAKSTIHSNKKVDSQLNTFARLSYMHKNKNSDVKFKKQLAELSNLDQQQILSRCVDEQKSAKLKYLQSKGQISILKVGQNAHSLLKDKGQVVVGKVDKPSSTAFEHPLLTNMLHGSYAATSKQLPRTETQVRNVPYRPEKSLAKETALSEKDQNDLLLLLRQQNKLNCPVPSSDVNKIVNPQLTTSKIAKASNATSINHNQVTCINNSIIRHQPTEFKNNNVQKFKGCTIGTVHCGSIPGTNTKSMECTSGNVSKTTTCNKINVKHSKIQNVTPCENQDMNLGLRQTYGSQDNVSQSADSEKNIIKKVIKAGSTKIPNITLTKVPNAISQSQPSRSDLTNIRPNENTALSDEQQDWESVMDALLSHKTPSLGPNALDVALKKDSFAKTALRNQRIVRKKASKVYEAKPHKHGDSSKHDVTAAHNVNPEHLVVTDLSIKKEIQKDNTKTVLVEPPKRCADIQKSFSGEAMKEKDPFISGIPNSDYDLLEELMDDELRKEIGELSSDEDLYRAPAVGSTKVIKTVPSAKCTNVNKIVSHQDMQAALSRCGSSNTVQSGRESIIQTNKRAAMKTYETPKNLHTNKLPVQAQNIVNKKSQEAKNKPKILERLPCSKIQAPVANVQSHTKNSEEQVYDVNQINNKCHVDLVDAMNMLIGKSVVQSNPVVAQSRLPAAPKVVVIGSEVLYNPFEVAAVQTPIPSGLCNVNHTPYVVNTTPNITVYQTTQFAAPVVNPVIIGNAMTVPTTERVLEKTSILSSEQSKDISSTFIDFSKSSEIIQDCTKASSENHDKSNADVISDKNVELKCINALDYTTQQNGNSEVDTKTKVDINFNKNSERKVLSEVQDKQPVNVSEKVDSKTTRNQRSPPESDLKKGVLEDDVKPSIELKSHKHPKITVDNITKVVKDDGFERIMMKRLAILDRTTLHRSSEPPIPLEYKPLITLKQKPNVAIPGQEITYPSKSSNANENNTAENILNKKDDQKQDKLSNENSKENESKKTSLRILLRSSNDLKAMTVTSDLQDQRNPVGRKTKVRLKSETKNTDDSKQKKCTDNKNYKEKVDTDSPKRISKRILSKKENSLKIVENNSDTAKQVPNETNKKKEKVLEVTEQVSGAEDVIKDDVEKKVVFKKAVLPTNKTIEPKDVPLIDAMSKVNDASNATDNIKHLALIDIENALLGSKIKKRKDLKLKKSDVNSVDVINDETESSQNNVHPKSAKRKKKLRKLAVANVNPRTDNVNETSDQVETDLAQAANQNNGVAPSEKEPTKNQNHGIAPSDKEPTKTGVTISIIRNKKGSGKPRFGIKTIDAKTKPVLTIRPTRSKISKKKKASVISEPTSNVEKLPDTIKNKEVSLKGPLKLCSAVGTKTTNKSHDLHAGFNDIDNSMNSDKCIKHTISPSGIQTRRPKSKDSVNVVNQNEFSSKTINDVLSPKTDFTTQSVKKDSVPLKQTPKTVHDTHVVPPKFTSKLESHTTKYVESPKLPITVLTDAVPPKNTSKEIESDLLKPNTISATSKINKQSFATSDKSSSTVAHPPQNDELNKATEKTLKVVPNPVEETTFKADTETSFEELKEKIIIEELPSPPNDPSKKCVRIKLPNGKTFKATVFGKMHVSFESIFADPALKSALLTNLSDNKRYTVNIKQVSTAAKNNPKKIVDARIEEVNVQAREIKPVETVNLLSDDEDDTDATKKMQTFKTEFGEYKILAINENDFQKQQNKLNQKCFVKLIKMTHTVSSSRVEAVTKLLPCDSDKKVEVGSYNALDEIMKAIAAVDEEIAAIDELNNLTSVTLKNQMYDGAGHPVVIVDDSKDDCTKALDSQNDKDVSCPIVIDDDNNDDLTTVQNNLISPIVKDHGNNKDNLTTTLIDQTDNYACCNNMVFDDEKNKEITTLKYQINEDSNCHIVSDDENHKDDLTTALNNETDKVTNCPIVIDDDDSNYNHTTASEINAICLTVSDDQNTKNDLSTSFNNQSDKDAICPAVLVDEIIKDYLPKTLNDPTDITDKENTIEKTRTFTRETGTAASCPIVLDAASNGDNLTKALNTQIDEDARCSILLDDVDKTSNFKMTLNKQNDKDTRFPIEIEDNNKDNFTTPMSNIIAKVISDVIEIDDSSNDSLDLYDTSLAAIEETLRKEIAIVLRQPLPETPKEKNKKPDGDIDKLKKLLLEDLGVELPIVKDKQVMAKPINEIKTIVKENKEVPPPVTTKQCFVRLENCDGLVEEYKKKIIKKQKCVVDLVRCDDIISAPEKANSNDNSGEIGSLENCSDDLIYLDAVDVDSCLNSESERSRSGSFSLLDELPIYLDHKIETSYEYGRSSPVMDVFDAIASLQRQSKTITKSNLPEQLEDTSSDIYELGRSSPVIEIFETIASYQRLFNTTHKKDKVSEKFKCCCDWYKTKHDLHLANADKVSIVIQHADNTHNLLLYQPIVTSSVNHLSELDIEEIVPTLKTLTVKLFQSDEILSRLRPYKFVLKKEAVQSPSHKLKRKLPNKEDTGVANKLIKVVMNVTPKKENKITINEHTEKPASSKNDLTKQHKDVKCSKTIQSHLLRNCQEGIMVAARQQDSWLNDAKLQENVIDKINDSRNIELKEITSYAKNIVFKITESKEEQDNKTDKLQKDTLITCDNINIEIQPKDVCIAKTTFSETVCQEKVDPEIDSENQLLDSKEVVGTYCSDVLEIAAEENVDLETRSNNQDNQIHTKETDQSKSSDEETVNVSETVGEENIIETETGYENNDVYSQETNLTESNVEKTPKVSVNVLDYKIEIETGSENKLLDSGETNQRQDVRKTIGSIGNVCKEIINSTSEVSETVCKQLVDLNISDNNQLKNYNETDQLQSRPTVCEEKIDSEIDLLPNNVKEAPEKISEATCKDIVCFKSVSDNHQINFNETVQIRSYLEVSEFSETTCKEIINLKTDAEDQLLDSNAKLFETTGKKTDNSESDIKNNQSISNKEVKKISEVPKVTKVVYNEKRNYTITDAEDKPLDFKETNLTPQHIIEPDVLETKCEDDTVRPQIECEIHSNETAEVKNYLEVPETFKTLCNEKIRLETDKKDTLLNSKETDQIPKCVIEASKVLKTIFKSIEYSKTDTEQSDFNKADPSQNLTHEVCKSTCVSPESLNKMTEEVVDVHIDNRTKSHENIQKINDKHDTKLPTCDIHSNITNLSNTLSDSLDSKKDISDIIKEQTNKTLIVLGTQISCKTIDRNYLKKVTQDEETVEISVNNADLSEVVTSQDIVKEKVIYKEDCMTSEREKNCSTDCVKLEIKADDKIGSIEADKDTETVKETKHEIENTEDIINIETPDMSDENETKKIIINQDKTSNDDAKIVSNQRNELPDEKNSLATQSCLSFEYQIEVEYQTEDSSNELIDHKSEDKEKEEFNPYSFYEKYSITIENSDVENEIEIISDMDGNTNTNEESSCDSQDSTMLANINIKEQVETTNAENVKCCDSIAKIESESKNEYICYTQNVRLLDHGYAFKRFCFKEECKTNIEKDVPKSCEPSPIHKTTADSIDNNEVVLNGIEYEDPVNGTCYVFPIAESPTDYETDSDILNDSTEEILQVIQEIGEDGTVDNVILKTKEVAIKESYFKLNMPKHTYSKNKLYYEKDSKLGRRSLKRKIDMTDIRISGKKYRKGKNIDHPKVAASSMLDSSYSKEYKQVFDYCSSLKFSYSQPFHKEYIDVEEIIKDWPLQGENISDFEDEIDSNDPLFQDLDIEQYIFFDPMEQSLADELTAEYRESDLPCSSNTETNFNMGFGEGSDRVIQNLEDVGDDSKFSAATLSDVKQPQPFLLSKDYENDQKETSDKTREDQIKQLRRYMTYIQMRDKVRSFFKKTREELLMKNDWMKKQEADNSAGMSKDRELTSFPFDLYTTTDFMELPPADVFVQVVQVGQLPVSAAAQNPVTCDPRVTQVSDASPSQCSVDNTDDSQPTIKTEYTELTTADLTNLPSVQEYAQHNQTLLMESQEQSNIPKTDENIPIETEIKSVVKIELMEETEVKEEQRDNYDDNYSPSMENRYVNNVDYPFDTNAPNCTPVIQDRQTMDDRIQTEADFQALYNSPEKQNVADTYATQEQQPKQQNGTPEKTDQIAHAMNAAGITTTAETMTNTTRAQALVNILSQKLRQGSIGATTNNYSKATSINAMSLQQALAQILPPPLNQTSVPENNQHNQNTSVTPQVLHIVQGKNASGSQITLVDNSQQSVINGPNSTPVLHIVQNKSGTTSAISNGAASQQTNSFGGLSLVDAGLQQGGNQLLHIVNTGNQKNSNATGQLLKRVNLLTNLANVQGSNEQKMVQFVCKSADGKAIQLNAPHQRSMVLRLQPIETTPKPAENNDLSPTSNSTNSLGGKDNAASQQEIKSRSVYEENYAKFIQNSSNKTTIPEKSTSLPKFNQAFGKPVFQDGCLKQNDMNSINSHLSVNTNSEGECQSPDHPINHDHIGQMNSPPLLLRKSSAQTSQSQANLVQQIKQTMNIQTMHGGVIYTRQIPVNIGGGQTINLITVPSTELVDESGQKQQPVGTHNDIEQSIIKIVPQNQTAANNDISSEEGNAQMSVQNENNQNPQPQPVLTQMRIKLPMLSKTPQMVSGARVVRPSFFQIQRNVIGGTNQPVYQQLVLTAAPPLGQQTIRLPQTQTNRQIKVPTENQSSAESQMSSSTLEQLREFDMVLEQVKERSSVPPNSNSNTTFPKLHTSSADVTDGSSASSTSTETTQQVLYSIGNNHHQLNVAYVNRKATVATPTTSTFVRSPDSSGIIDSPTSSTHVQIPHTVTTDSSHSEQSTQPKPKVSSKSKSRPKASSNPPNTLKLNPVPPKTSTQKPLEDEQTTQRILYILAEYKEQVENSPDKDKPAPRRRTNPPSNPSGSSKRKKSSSGSRKHGRDLSPINGEDTCRTMGSEDSSCGTSQGDCNESCVDSHSPQDSPRKVVRKLTFEHEIPPPQPRPQPQRNVIVADGQTITVARGTAGKPATAVLMPANYILPVSMVKGGQQIAIVTNRGPKLLTVGGGEGGTNALLLQRLIGPAGLKPVLTRPGVRHVRLPTAALHNLQAFNLATATTVQPPDSTASPAPAPTPPELVDTRATSSPWADRDCQDVKPERGSSPEGSEPWNLASSDPHEYSYEETVRTDHLNRTVLDPIPDRYSPDMEAQRIFDKMFDVESRKSYLGDSPRCVYDIDASDCDDKPYHQVVQKRDGHRQHRLTHVSAAALRHKYAILEHELRLQKSLSEECEDLGVDSPSASELFPEAELLFSSSPAHDHTQDHGHHSHTPQPILLNHSGIPQPDIDDQIATDQLLSRGEMHDEQQELHLGLEDVGMVGAGLPAALDAEEFARAHPNTTFHSEPTDEVEVQPPFTIAGLKGRHITSTIFHSNRAPATVLMTAPQTTVISQATADGNTSHGHNVVKYDIDNMINSLPPANGNNINLSSVLVKDQGLTRFESILSDSRELHLSNTASTIVHSSGNATQVIRRVCYDDDKRDNRFLMDEPEGLIAGDDAKMVAGDNSRDATLVSMAGEMDDDRSSPGRHAELFWESNSASERSESRRPIDFSSDSEKCCKSPSYDETNSTDSSGVGTQMRLDSVIKNARGMDRSASADGSSADDTHPPLRTYPPKRLYHPLEREAERSLSGKTRAGQRSPDGGEVRRRASGRGVVKRGCHCCSGEPAPPRPKKSRQRKPTMDFTN